VGFVLDAYAARSCPLKTVYRFTPGLEPPVDRLPDPPFFHDADAIEAAVFARLLASDDETHRTCATLPRPTRRPPSAPPSLRCARARRSSSPRCCRATTRATGPDAPPR
jgi:hypothetical protein